MFDTYPTKSDARSKAEEYAEPMDSLINASDIYEHADEWDDVPTDQLREAAFRQAEVTLAEHDEMRHLADELAFRMWMEDLNRISEDALDDGVSDWEAVSEHRVWPNQWNKAKLHEVMHVVFTDPRKRGDSPLAWYRQDAERVVRGALADGAMPDA